MSSFECAVCATKTTNKQKIICSFCNFESCRNCLQKWVLSTEKNPECMSCHNQITWDTLNQLTTKTFINNDYRNHRRNVLLDREKALIPNTMHLVEREKQIRELKNLLNNIYDQKKSLLQQIRELDQSANEIYRNMSRIRHGEAPVDSKKVFNLKCPVDDCKGFLDSKKYCCICENTICTKCMKIKDENHECDQGDIDTVKLIQSQTKPCPNCATRIQKSHGCSQMWCVECKVFFNWNTGEIITSGPLHNPEYLEWMRNTGQQLHRHRELGDEYCGGVPTIIVTHNVLKSVTSKFKSQPELINPVFKEITELSRRVNHITDYMRHYPVRGLDQINQSNRILYILGDLSEEKFARELQLSERTNNYNNEIRSIVRLAQEVVTDKLRELITNKEFTENRGMVSKTAESAIQMYNTYINTVKPELNKFNEYVNNALLKIAKRYNRKQLKCTETFGGFN